MVNWLVTFRYAGNLQNVPFSGEIVAYNQIEVGLIEVAGVVPQDDLKDLVNRLVSTMYCNKILIEPYFEFKKSEV